MALQDVKVLADAGSAVGAAYWWGYPYAVALSAPTEPIRPNLRRVAFAMAVGFCLFLIYAVFVAELLPETQGNVTFRHQPALATASVVTEVLLIVFAFGSFVVGTMALNDRRIASGTDSPLMSLETYLAFFCGPIGGWVYTQRLLKGTRHAGYAGPRAPAERDKGDTRQTR
jgi:hypothetical protein